MNEQEARQALGQVVALRFPRSWETLDLERFPVANYIIFKDALESTLDASRDRIAEARALLRSKGIEPLFMIDEEGGRVTQISEFFDSAPSPRAIAKTLRPEEAADIYAQLAAFLARLGIDINLAPCLDVDTEPLNPIIATRSFGGDVPRVVKFGEMAIRGMRRSIACVAKHFPGHGMTKRDSHLSLPIVDDTRETLTSTHIEPFKDAMKWYVDGIMVSHCVYRALETEEIPACLSRQIVCDHLRLNLGYDGLVFTDSLDMRAVTQNFGPRQAAVLAFEAACDILLYTELSERFTGGFEGLLDMLLMGKLSRDHLARSIARRKRIFERSELTQGFKPTFDDGIYSPLVQQVRRASVRIEGDQGMLPLPRDNAAVISTSSQVVQKLQCEIASVDEISTRLGDLGDAAGKPLIVWLTEPLAVRHSLEALRSIMRTSQKSILVTTYEPVATALAESHLSIVTDDTSPQTEDAIIKRLFEAR